MALTGNLPDDEDLVGRLRLSVTRLARVLRQDSYRGLAPTDIALLTAIAWEGEPTLGSLAVNEHVAPPTVTKSINKLESEGLVERVADREDGRVTRVRLSATGRRVVVQYRARERVAGGADRQPLRRDRNELARTVNLLERLVAQARLADAQS